MWQFYYLQAHQIAQDRRSRREPRATRSRRPAEPRARRSRFDGLRRSGAVVAAGIARRLDECVAREELGLRTTDERLGIAG